ncbi:MAG TPA: cyclic nucleotide-binding domain-containing protein, partial [Polyangiaceae bacterium]|nr:cyclic nucleotide-binding domain-containing protein [Polyangiaceae bacterium]
HLLDSDRIDERVEACRVLGELGGAGFRPVRDLLGDPERKVRHAALRAARHVGDPRLTPLLVNALDERSTRAPAGAALVAIGPPAAPPLLELFDDPETPRDLQLVLPRLLRRIPCAESFDGLRLHLDHPDGHVRLRVMTGMASVRHRLAAPPIELDALQRRLEDELRRGYHRLGAWHRAEATHGTELLAFAHVCYARRTGKRLLRLLSLRYDKRALDLVRKGLAIGARRGNALELLDSLLEPGPRALVMPWFDDSPVERRLANADDLAGPVAEPIEYLRECTIHPNPYLRSLALEALARHRSDEGRAIAKGLLEDPSALVQEMARAAFDPAPSQARGTMYTTLEKVLLLKSATVFEKVDAEDLAPMAQAAEELSFDAGDTIIEEGEVGDVLYLVNRGRVTVLRGGARLATLGPGETFGEMAVLDAEPRSATVRAEVETSCLAIASEDFYDVLREQVEIAEGVIRMLTHRLRVVDRAEDPVSMVPPSPET